MSNGALIVAAARTAVAREGGALKDLGPEVYGAAAIKEALRRASLDGAEVDDVIFGNVLGGGGNLARLSLLEAGLPVDVPGMTIDRQCSSGAQAIAIASDLIKAGTGSVYVAGGTESMTRAPYLMARP